MLSIHTVLVLLVLLALTDNSCSFTVTNKYSAVINQHRGSLFNNNKLFLFNAKSETQLRTNSNSGSNSYINSNKNNNNKNSNELPREILLPKSDKRYYWDLSRVAFSLLPLAPGARRKTVVEELVKGKVWTLDQLQGIVNVNVPVRSTIIKLKSGGLFVYNPVAPTKECIDIVKNLVRQYGPVKHIVLGSLGLEHKALAGPFSQYFPDASVWLQPGQWSFPINLPNSFFGFPLGSRLNIIPENNSDAPWKNDFDHAVLGPLKFKSVGGFGETAFYHYDTKSLLVTDIVVSIPDKPPAIIEDDPRPLLFHSRDDMLDGVQDTTEARLRGWRRMTLFGLVFFPSGISVEGIVDTFAKLPKTSKTAEVLGKGAIPISGAIYPWKWVKSEEKNFKALQGGLLVAPILRELILNREPDVVLNWADQVSKWNIKRIIPSHLQNNIPSSSKSFRKAFDFLEKKNINRRIAPSPEPDDLFLLSTLSDVLTKFGVIAPKPY